MTGLPTPAVSTVDFALSKAVTPCVSPATPPPAMIAVVHFSIGGKSVITAADTRVPATTAAGGGQGVEQIVDAWNVVGEDFHQRRHAEHHQRRRRSKPSEVLAQRKMPGIGRRAHHEHRQEDAEAGGRREPDAKGN